MDDKRSWIEMIGIDSQELLMLALVLIVPAFGAGGIGWAVYCDSQAQIAHDKAKVQAVDALVRDGRSAAEIETMLKTWNRPVMTK